MCGVQLQQEIGKEVHDLCYIDLLVDSSWGATTTQETAFKREKIEDKPDKQTYLYT